MYPSLLFIYHSSSMLLSTLPCLLLVRPRFALFSRAKRVCPVCGVFSITNVCVNCGVCQVCHVGHSSRRPLPESDDLPDRASAPLSYAPLSSDPLSSVCDDLLSLAHDPVSESLVPNISEQALVPDYHGPNNMLQPLDFEFFDAEANFCTMDPATLLAIKSKALILAVLSELSKQENTASTKLLRRKYPVLWHLNISFNLIRYASETRYQFQDPHQKYIYNQALSPLVKIFETSYMVISTRVRMTPIQSCLEQIKKSIQELQNAAQNGTNAGLLKDTSELIHVLVPELEKQLLNPETMIKSLTLRISQSRPSQKLQ